MFNLLMVEYAKKDRSIRCSKALNFKIQTHT